jgi:hypothetical protein
LTGWIVERLRDQTPRTGLADVALIAAVIPDRKVLTPVRKELSVTLLIRSVVATKGAPVAGQKRRPR